MKNRFFVADWHLGHSGVWEKFKKADGVTPLRPFTSTEEMNNALIERHNAVVKDNDVVYVLGDCVINKKYLPLIKQMNGSKRLIRGNHDIFSDDLYYEAGFTKIVAYRVFVDDFICSHIPLHPDCVSQRYKTNLHGHLHSGEIMDKDGNPDSRYLCVSVEHTDFSPISYDEVKDRIAKRQKQ